ncbi:zinc finger protein 350-like isoform X2 [Trichoplusia ni]|uniref:Zinc finger protein 350-like isoform X2 n=1 Tax=Trichoplusia ni TaxID=7111 RepID=A0A7E5WY04_TRINI|nr:zinc finger protein 350-like isoform X2 [Trichoplusia ni]
MLAVLILNRLNKLREARKQKSPNAVPAEKKPALEEIMYCRTCLGTDDLVSIFFNKEDETKKSEDLRLVTGLEIKMNDGLSQKICAQCIEIMNTALQFRRTSRKAERTLIKLASGDLSKKKSPTGLQKPSTKPKLKTAKVEKVEMNDYSYEIYSEEFQNDGEDYQEFMADKEAERRKEKEDKKTRKKISDQVRGSYKCQQCGKEFRMRATFKAHVRFHTNYCVCELCGKRCRNNVQLQEHKRARHGLRRIHQCNYCDYSSATKEALTIHERRHTGERPYVCDHCGATFHRRSNLVQHIAIHLPEKNFQCSICKKRERSKKRLQVHVHKAHRMRDKYRYMCPQCPKIYSGPDHVRRHLVNHHNIPRPQQGPIDKFLANGTCSVSVASRDSFSHSLESKPF